MTDAKTSIQGKLITLTFPTEKDYFALKDVLNDQKTMASLIPFFQRSEWTDEQVRERYESFQQAYVIGKGVTWAVHSLNEKVVVGNCGFKNISKETSEAEFGIILSKSCWGKGHALECHLLGLDFGFSQLGLTRVYFNTDEVNQRMHHFFEKCGVRFFKRTSEGYLQFELLKEDWAGIRPKIANLLEQKIRLPVGRTMS